MKSVVTEQAEFQSEGIEGSPEDAKLVQQGGLEAMVLELQRRLEAAETRITEVTTSSRRAEQTLQVCCP